MTEQTIPTEMLDAATKAIIKRALELDVRECGDDDCAKLAEAALEAAGVPALLDERDGLRFVHGELSEATMEAQAEVRELRARVAELEASHRRLLIFASDLYAVAANGYLDDELLAMRGVKALTAKIFSKEEVEEAYGWLEDVAAAESGEGE